MKTDDELRSMWRDAGGEFHGPHIETGTMQETKLFAFLRNLLAVAPTPPAAEVEPVAIVDYRSVAVWLNAIKPCEGTKLYTRPANNRLRKAAEVTDASLEALLYISDDGITHSELAKSIIAIRDNLRAELNKDKSC